MFEPNTASTDHDSLALIQRAQPIRSNKTAVELTDHELLTALLGARNELVCERLISAYGNLRSLAAAHPLDLKEQGVSASVIERLNAVFELAKRYAETPWKVGEPLRASADVYEHFKERLACETVEFFYAVLLDNKHRRVRDVLVSKGSLTASIVHPRDLFAQVVRHSVAAILLVHNHPSGSPEPSKEDIEITRRLREVGELVGVRVLDHIVIGKGRYVSFQDDGYW